MELGNPAEAMAELSRIEPRLLTHPDVLLVRWQISAELRDWETALQTADALIEAAPEKPTGWLHRAYALRRTPGGSLEKAWEALRPVYDKFPSVSILPYNLACYAAQMGRLEEAWDWFQKAIKVADDVKELQRMALGDPDLKPLWERIQKPGS